MFDFSIFVTLLISTLIFYLTTYFNLKNEIDDFTSSSSLETKEDRLKYIYKMKKIYSLTIITIIIIFIIISLYNLPLVIFVVKKILPFRNGFFSNANFTFSFITGSILLSMAVIIVWTAYDVTICPVEVGEHILQKIILLLLTIGLIWIDNFISLFLSYCIIHYFELLSIILNIIIYTFITIFLMLMLYLYDKCFQ